MKRSFLPGLLLAVLCLFATAVSAQFKVSVTPMLSPPYPPNIDHYLRMTGGLLTVTNHTNAVLQVQLHGFIENSDNGLYIRTKEGYHGPQPLVLQAFETKTISANSQALRFFDDGNTETNADENTKRALSRTRMLPEGVYSYCVQALDYNTGEELSANQPAGCSSFTIGNPEPPALVFPECGSTVTEQFPLFSWTPPVGNLAGAEIRYDLFVVKLIPGHDANDLMRMAMSFGAGNPFVKRRLLPTNYQYMPSDPPLERGKTYAWAVVASDVRGNMVIQNEGKTEVCTFIYDYAAPHVLPDNPSAIANQNSNSQDPPASCVGCTMVLNNTSPVPTTLAEGETFTMGKFPVHILTVSDSAGIAFTGTGYVPVPFVNSSLVRIRVDFKSIKLNSNKQAVDGIATGMINPDGTSLVPNFEEPDLDFSSLSAPELSNISDYLAVPGHVIDELQQSYNSVGFEMPLGINKNGHTLAIRQVFLHPTFATFDAMLILDIHEWWGDATPVALGASDICFKPDDICGVGKLFLSKDFAINLSAKHDSLVLKGTENGTYVEFDDKGFKELKIKAQYVFSKDQLERIDNSGDNVRVTLTATAQSFENWIASVQMDEFRIKGIPDITFKPDAAGAFYDHSSIDNPTVPPALLQAAGINGIDWHGFWWPKLQVVLNNDWSNGGATTINLKDLIVDSSGVSLQAQAVDIFTMGKLKVDSWKFSLDSINLKIAHNSFNSAGLYGKFLLNITEATSQLDYSCLLNYSNSKLNYQFLVQPKDNIKVPLWIADLEIFNTSHIMINNANGSFYGEALFNGKITLAPEFDGMPKVELAHVEFKGMKLMSEAPYFTFGDPDFSLASPPHGMGGFPLTLKDVHLVTENQMPGLRFTVLLDLTSSDGMLPKASTTLSFFGKFDANMNPVFDHAQVDTITLEGNLSVLYVKGKIVFFHQDPTFGNGFRGEVFLDIKPVSVQFNATIQFGQVSDGQGPFDYWYVDALVMLKEQGIMVFPGVQIFGFGGGAYYHMARQNQVQDVAMSISGSSTPNNTPNPGMTPSGVIYVPDRHVDIGLKAKIFVGLQKIETFNADVAFEIMVKNGGVTDIWIDGNARMMSDAEMSTGTVTGNVKAHFDFVQQIFTTRITATLNIQDILHGEGTISFYFEGAKNDPEPKWYLYFGRPMQDSTMKLSIAKLLDIETYFEMGNFQVDEMPPPPAWVMDIINNDKDNKVDPYAMAQSRIPGSGYKFRIIHGGSAEFKTGGQFLIFYGDLHAGFGYDLEIVQLEAGCDGAPASGAGLGGWYATGQAYAGIETELGIQVDMGPIQGRYTIVDAGLAAVLNAGFANPTWIEGHIGGYYNLFDGAISGKIDYDFEYADGSGCKPDQPDFLDQIQVVSDIYPRPDGSGSKTCSAKQDVTVIPAMATILKMDGAQQIHVQTTDNDGKTVHRLFRFDDDMVKLELKKNGVLMAASDFTRDLSADGYGLALNPKAWIDRLSDYNFKVTATMEECHGVMYHADTKYATCNGTWEAAVKKNGGVFSEIKEVAFKTDQGLETIPESSVEYTFPYQRERFFVYQNIEDAHIKLNKGFNINSFNLPSAVARAKARWVPLNPAGNAKTVEIDLTEQNKQLNFEYPAQLQPSTYYSVQIIAQWEGSQQNGNQSPNSSKAFTTTKSVGLNTIFYNANVGVLAAREVNGANLQLKANQKQLYEMRFHTSKYPDLQSKMDAMEYYKVSYHVVTGKDASKDVVLNGNEIGTPEQIVSKINQKMGYPSGTVPKIWYTPYIYMQGDERFDKYDVEGYKTRKPYIAYENYSVSGWHQDLVQDVLKILFDKKLAQLPVEAYKFIGKYGGTGKIVQSYMKVPATAPLIAWDEAFGSASGGSGGSGKPGAAGYNQYEQMNGVSNNSNIMQQQQGSKGYKRTIDFYAYLTTASGGKGLETVENVLLGDIYVDTRWLVDPSPEEVIQYHERLGSAFDFIGTQVQNVNLGVNPVIGVKAGGKDFKLPGFGGSVRSGTGKK